jgi:hypothetical protein
MNGSEEIAPGRGRAWTRFPDLGARSHIRVLPRRGTEGSNPSPSSAESSANPISWIMVGAGAREIPCLALVGEARCTGSPVRPLATLLIVAAKEPLPGRLGYLGKSPGLTLGQPARSSGAASASVISTVLSAPTARVGPPNGETPSRPAGGPNDHFWGLVAAG